MTYRKPAPMRVLLVLLLVSWAGCAAPEPGASHFIEPVWGPYSEPAENKTFAAVIWWDSAEWTLPAWEVNETMLQRFPILSDLLHLGTLLGVENGTHQVGNGYFDRDDARDVYAYEMEMIWKWPDGDNGTKYSRTAWHYEDRIYAFSFHELHRTGGI